MTSHFDFLRFSLLRLHLHVCYPLLLKPLFSVPWIGKMSWCLLWISELELSRVFCTLELELLKNSSQNLRWCVSVDYLDNTRHTSPPAWISNTHWNLDLRFYRRLLRPKYLRVESAMHLTFQVGILMIKTASYDKNWHKMSLIGVSNLGEDLVKSYTSIPIPFHKLKSLCNDKY